MIFYFFFSFFSNNSNHAEMMPWLFAIILSCVLPATTSEAIAQNDFRFIHYHGELKMFNSLLLFNVGVR